MIIMMHVLTYDNALTWLFVYVTAWLTEDAANNELLNR